MDKIRAANLRLLRHGVFNTDQTNFADTIEIAQSKFSEYERGKVPLSNRLARQIETAFGLPEEWMDRDNSDIFLSKFEYDLVKNIRRVNTEQQKEIINIIGGILNLIGSEIDMNSKLSQEVGVSLAVSRSEPTEVENNFRNLLAKDAPITEPRRQDYPNQIAFLKDKIRYAQSNKKHTST